MNLARIEDITNGLPVFMPSGIQARLFLEGDNIEVEYPELYRDSYTKEDFQKLIDEGITVFYDIPKPYQSALMENLVKKGYIRESLGKEIDQPLEEAFNQEDNKPGDVYTALKDKEENGLEYVTPEFKNELLTCLTKICKEYPIVKVRQQALTFIDELGLQEYYDIKAVKDFINKYTDLLNAHVCESLDECDKKLTDKLGKALDKIVMAQRLGDLKKEQQAKNEYQEIKAKLTKCENMDEYSVCKDVEKGYFYICSGMDVYCDEDGEPYHFETHDEAEAFLREADRNGTLEEDTKPGKEFTAIEFEVEGDEVNGSNIVGTYDSLEDAIEAHKDNENVEIYDKDNQLVWQHESLNEEESGDWKYRVLGIREQQKIIESILKDKQQTIYHISIFHTIVPGDTSPVKISVFEDDKHSKKAKRIFLKSCIATPDAIKEQLKQIFEELDVINYWEYPSETILEKFCSIDESLNEEQGPYYGSEALGQIASEIETGAKQGFEPTEFGNWLLNTSWDMKWEQLTNEMALFVCEKIAIAVADGHVSYDDLELVFHEGCGLTKEDLLSAQVFDEEQIANILGEGEDIARISFELQFDGNLEVGESFKQKDKKKKKQKIEDSLNEEEGAGVYVKDKEGKISGPYTDNEAAKDYIKQMVEQGCKEEDFEITTDNGEEEMQETILVQEAFKVYNTAYGEVKEQGTFANWNEVQDYLDQEWGKYNVDMVKENPTFGTQLDKENFMNNYDVEIIEVPVTIEKNVIKLVEPEQAEVEGASSNKGEKSMLPQDEKPEIEQPEIEVCPKCGKNPCECNPNKPECPECEEEPCSCEDECCPECGCEPCECEKDEKIEEDFGDEHIGEIEGEDEYKEVSGVTVDTDEVNPEEIINGEIQFTPAEAETIGNMEPGEKILLPNEQPELDAGYSTGATEIIVTDIDDKTPEEEQLPIEGAEPEEIVGDIEDYIKTLLDDEDEEVEIEVVEVPECMEGPKSPEDVKKEKEEEEEKNEDFQDNMGMLTDVKDLDMPDALADTIDTKEDGSLYKIGDLAKELEELKSMFKSEIENIKNDIKSALQDVKQDIKMDVNNVENKVNDTKTAVDDLTVEEEEPVEEAPAEEEEIENEEPIEAEEEIEESMGEVNPIAEAIEKTLKTKMSKTTFYNKLNENYGYNCLSESNISLKMMVDGYVEANKLNKYIIDESLEQEQADEAKYLKNKYLRKGKLENLEDVKKKIDQYTSQNKSSEDIKNAITLLSDNDEEKEQATDYAVEKMKESLLQTSQTSKLLNLSAGSGIGYKK